MSMLSLLRDLYDDQHGNYPGLLLDNYLDSSASPHLHFYVSKPRSSASKFEPRNDPSRFQLMLNVKHFKPDEIEVKTVDDFVVIHGKHEEHADEHGFVSREFTRRYQLPADVEPASVSSSLSRDGVLTIQGPRKQLPPPENERVIPVTIQQPAAVEEAQKQQNAQEKTSEQ